MVGIDIDAPDTGDYVITIGGYNIPMEPQPYALVASGGDLTQITQIPGIPDTPGDLSATKVSDSQIDLSWTDNSTDEDGFSIERRTSAGSFAEIDTTPADTATYSDMNVSAGNTYHYRVRSFINTIGYSSYSNEAVVTIESPPSPSPPPAGGGGGGGGGCSMSNPEGRINIGHQLIFVGIFALGLLIWREMRRRWSTYERQGKEIQQDAV